MLYFIIIVFFFFFLYVVLKPQNKNIIDATITNNVKPNINKYLFNPKKYINRTIDFDMNRHIVATFRDPFGETGWTAGKRLKCYDKLILEHDFDDSHFKKSIMVKNSSGDFIGYLDQETTKTLFDLSESDIKAYYHKKPLKTKLEYLTKPYSLNSFSEKIYIIVYCDREKQQQQIDEETNAIKLSLIDLGLKLWRDNSLSYDEKIEKQDAFIKHVSDIEKLDTLYQIYWHSVKLMATKFKDNYTEETLKVANLNRSRLTRKINKNLLKFEDFDFKELNNII